jgi:hypothetical protein
MSTFNLHFLSLAIYWFFVGSDDTQARARDGQVEALSSDTEIVQVSDYVLSIVPPRDALVGVIAIWIFKYLPAMEKILRHF